tara:strand:+ start:358 stop:1254 length:897 start_codon:yes stop_codon:yes gene_type:complete
MTILVTGATGFVGERVTNMLLQTNRKIRIISRSNTPTFKDLRIMDLTSANIPKEIFSGVSDVIHMAGYAHDVRSGKNDEQYIKLNYEATKDMAEIASQCGVTNFIFLSSTKAGKDDHIVTSVEEAEGIYGKSKRLAELALIEIASKSNMRVNIIRPALIYGPNVKGNLSSMIKGIRQGWFPPLPETNNSRSMVHVDDVANSILFLMTNESLNKQILNVTDNKDYSSSEIYDTLCNILEKRIRKIRFPYLLFKVISHLHPSIKYKVNKLLGSETYSCSKLLSYGFKPEKTLKQINETIY